MFAKDTKKIEIKKKVLSGKSENSVKDYRGFSNLKNVLRNLLFKKRFLLRLNHNPKSFEFRSNHASAKTAQFDDKVLVERLKDSYIACDTAFEGNKDSVWSGIFQHLHGDIHSAFIEKDDQKIADILRNPGKYNLFYGFENLCRDLIKAKRLEDILEPQMVMDSLISLCEAVGFLPVANSESLKISRAINPETAVRLLEKEFGFNLLFPNPFEGEFGIETKSGIISYRAIQAVYQAWSISRVIKDMPNPKVLEIGGGLGRTAYYCRHFGIMDYTIVDIPISSLAQGNFLGRVLPEQDLTLFGESSDTNKKIKLIHPNAFFSSERKYDLIVNVDSLTELDIGIAKQYLQKIGEVSNLFLSINHESNSFSVNSIWKERHYLNKLHRNPYWLRRGYVEELFKNDHVLI